MVATSIESATRSLPAQYINYCKKISKMNLMSKIISFEAKKNMILQFVIICRLEMFTQGRLLPDIQQKIKFWLSLGSFQLSNVLAIKEFPQQIRGTYDKFSDFYSYGYLKLL